MICQVSDYLAKKHCTSVPNSSPNDWTYIWTVTIAYQYGHDTCNLIMARCLGANVRLTLMYLHSNFEQLRCIVWFSELYTLSGREISHLHGVSLGQHEFIHLSRTHTWNQMEEGSRPRDINLWFTRYALKNSVITEMLRPYLGDVFSWLKSNRPPIVANLLMDAKV